VRDSLVGRFGKLGYLAPPASHIVNRHGRTELVIAGVQYFDAVVHHGAPAPPEAFFIAQPCVRMQFQESIARDDDVSTAFVNVCTARASRTFSEHLAMFDEWCGALSALGLFMGDFTIVMREKRQDWGTGEFAKHELFLVYGGLELGDASYGDVPRAGQEPLVLSDIGFGLERVAWALSKSSSYFDLLVPLSASVPREMADACRTIALLALSGVVPSNKGPGLQFRRLAKTLAERYYGETAFSLIQRYFPYWSAFTDPSVGEGHAARVARLEVERMVNLAIAARLWLPPPREETTEDYFARLVYAGFADPNVLRAALPSCKT
jgi:hypothetical protein